MKRGFVFKLALTFILILSLASTAFAAGTPEQVKAKNVIIAIGDGMGFGALQLARNVLIGPDGKFVFETFPAVGYVTTYSADNLVTDSAAAATAIATGYKTNNGMIAVKPDGTPVQTILEAMKKAGKATGLVATNTIYDATPAAFGAHWGTRGGSEEISAQLLDAGIDVLLGGGREYFLPANDGGKRKDGRNLIKEAAAKGYAVATTGTELKAVSGKKLLGLFHPSYMNYQTDRAYLGADEPTLTEMAAKALEALKGSENGFFLMIEGSRIDHAAHAGDAAGVVAEMNDFANAVKLAYEFAKANPDTLLIVTADHDTMGFSVTEPFDYSLLKQVKVSPEFMAGQFEKGADGKFTEDSVRRAFMKFAGIRSLTDEQMALIQANAGQAAYRVGYAVGAVIAQNLKLGIVSPSVQAESNTGGHTGNPVPLFATGVGSELFSGVMDNTEIPGKIAKAAGISF